MVSVQSRRKCLKSYSCTKVCYPTYVVLKQMAIFTIRIVGSQFEQILINLLSKTIYKNDRMPLIKQLIIRLVSKEITKSMKLSSKLNKTFSQISIICNKKQAKKLLY